MSIRIAGAGKWCSDCPFFEAVAVKDYDDNHTFKGTTIKCTRIQICNHIHDYLLAYESGKEYVSPEEVLRRNTDDLLKGFDTFKSDIFKFNK